MFHKFSIENVYQGRLKEGEDLYYGFLNLIKKENINGGSVSAIGSVSGAALGFFNQEDGTYKRTVINKPMEILSVSGNISLKNGVPFPHLHIFLSDTNFSTVGGHLLPGTTVYSVEYEIFSYTGDSYNRRTFNDETKLFQWEF